MQRPSASKIQHFQEVANQQIKIITFAPEVEGAHDTLNQLHEDIIFSMGHTVATFDERMSGGPWCKTCNTSI